METQGKHTCNSCNSPSACSAAAAASQHTHTHTACRDSKAQQGGASSSRSSRPRCGTVLPTTVTATWRSCFLPPACHEPAPGPTATPTGLLFVAADDAAQQKDTAGQPAAAAAPPAPDAAGQSLRPLMVQYYSKTPAAGARLSSMHYIQQLDPPSSPMWQRH